MKSIYNHGDYCDVIIYTGKNYTGNSATIRRGESWDMTYNTTFTLNGIASNKWVNCT
ncbi:hypothetical protein [Streptomyces sp. UG1]|uniref:hypothetical protein n=1 Tax=Streptomyces sp. UG1 TaxID=3417652 RepID=UPI003CF61CE9